MQIVTTRDGKDKDGNVKYPKVVGQRRVQIGGFDKSKTEQSHKKRQNINTIVAKIRQTKMMPQPVGTPIYGDFSNCDSYHAALDKVISATNRFNKLPSAIRSKFQNDPGRFIEFVNDPKNVSDCIDMGIFKRPANVDRVSVDAALEQSTVPQVKDKKGDQKSQEG